MMPEDAGVQISGTRMLAMCVKGLRTLDTDVACSSEEMAEDEAQHVVLQLTGLHARAETGVTRHEEGQDVVWPSRLGDAGAVLVAGPHCKIFLE